MNNSSASPEASVSSMPEGSQHALVPVATQVRDVIQDDLDYHSQAVKNLIVVDQDGTLYVSGTLPSYYAKQLVIEAIRRKLRHLALPCDLSRLEVVWPE